MSELEKERGREEEREGGARRERDGWMVWGKESQGREGGSE